MSKFSEFFIFDRPLLENGEITFFLADLY